LVNIGFNNLGDIYIVEFIGNSIKKFSSSYSPISFTFTSGGTAVSFNKPSSIAFDGSGNIYISDFDTVRKFSNTGSLIATIGTWTMLNPGTSSAGQNQPGSIAFDSSSNVYVTAPVENKVYKFSPSGNFYVEATSWGSFGLADGEFNAPSGIAVNGSSVYVADSQNQRIQNFTDSGVFQDAWSISALSPSLPNFNPTCLATDNFGNIFVTISFSSCVLKLSSSGELLATIGTPHAGSTAAGSAEGQFNQERGVAVDGNGFVYVADTGNNRLEKFTNSGVFVSVFYGQIPAALSFNSAVNVAVDKSGNIFVVDYIGNSIKKFSSEYNPIASS
jgi:tripartite motif-containing protein 71